MARSLKGARHITVNEVAYRWRATGIDECTSAVIWPADPYRRPSGEIVCRFGYNQVCTPAGPGHWRLEHQIVITNRIVRRIILHAIAAHRYEPAGSSRPLDLGVLDRVIGITDALRS